jgi:beta-glucosidase
MCSYNRINGIYASQNRHLLKEILKGEWGFKGAVISDWDANHTIFESVQGGLDLEMPGPAKYYGRLLEQAVTNWQIDIKDIDDAVRRILGLIVKTGKHKGGVKRKAGSVNTREHQLLARQLAEESIVLLKNDGGLLPLDMRSIKCIAVIGPNAAEGRIGGGGSSYVVPPYRVSPLEGLKSQIGDTIRIIYEKGCDNSITPPVVPVEWLRMPDHESQGLLVEYFNNPGLQGEPEFTSQEQTLDFWWSAGLPYPGQFRLGSACWKGFLVPPESNIYQIVLQNNGYCRIILDGDVILENSSPATGEQGREITSRETVVTLEKGNVYPLRIDFVRHLNQDYAHMKLCMQTLPDQVDDQRMEMAVSAARQCDVALVFAGMPEGYETEGWDRPDMELPGQQNDLIDRVVQANPRTVVVLNCGAPVRLPWVEKVPAVINAFYPGMEGGNAMAKILFGEINPSGKLPVTFPKRLEDNPAFINYAYPGARDINYGEGIFVGYRYYDKRQIEPAFPFGHGLSYTDFWYGEVIAPDHVIPGDNIPVKITVKNVGTRPGKEVVQLYIRDIEASLPRPVKELKGFKKVFLQPGEEKSIEFSLSMRNLAFYDPYQKDWIAEPGEYEILVGSSSRDIRAQARFMLISQA